jgi:hypothetical protein
MDNPIEFRPNADGGDDIYIHTNTSAATCRKCLNVLYGGEIEAGICDSCDDTEYVD